MPSIEMTEEEIAALEQKRAESKPAPEIPKRTVDVTVEEVAFIEQWRKDNPKEEIAVDAKE